MSNKTPANLGLTANSNSTPILTTSMKGHSQRSRQTMMNQSSASSSSSYPPPNFHILMVCGKCRQALLRCSICMMNLTTYIEDASYAYEPLPDKYTSMSSQLVCN